MGGAMQFSKVDLSKLLAIGQDGDRLSLVLDRGNTLEVIEVPAPAASYQALQVLNAIANADIPKLIASLNVERLPGEPAVPMLPVRSAMASAVGYDRDRRLLQIEFRNGSVYQYENVAEAAWEALKDTNSIGQFFNREIKGNYRSRRVA